MMHRSKIEMAPMRPAMVQLWSHFRKLIGSKWSRFALKIAAIAAGVSLASYTHLLNIVGLDDRIERLQLEQMDFSINVPLPETLKMVYLKNDDVIADLREGYAKRPQVWRRAHSQLLRALGNAPRLVAFDVDFPEPDNDADSQSATADLGAAIHDATMRVLVGVADVAAPEPIPPLKYADAALTRAGGLRLENGAESELVRRYVLAVSPNLPANFTAPLPATPSLALMMRLADLVPSRTKGLVKLDRLHEQIVLYDGERELRRIACDVKCVDRQCVATIPLHYPRHLITEGEKYVDLFRRLPNLARDFKGKIVLIGVQNETDIAKEGERVALTPDQKRAAYGYQVHAAVFGDLTNESYPRHLKGVWVILVYLAVALFAALGRSRLPTRDVEVDTHLIGKRKLPLGLLILFGLYAVAVWIFYRSAFILFNFAYGVIAIAAAYYFCGAASQPAVKPAEEAKP